MEEVVLKYKLALEQFDAQVSHMKKEALNVEGAMGKSAKKSGQAFNEAGNKAAASMQGLLGKVTQVGAAIGIAFSAQAAINFGASSVKAFADAEKAAQQLLFALKGREDVQKRLIQQAKELQKATVFEDDAIVAQQAYLATQGRTEAQIRKTIEAAVQLATVTGDTLEGAVQKLDATYEGNIGRLGKLDSRFKDLTQTELANGAAIDLVAQKYAGFAENAATTTAGKLEQLSNWFGDLKEGIGAAIVAFADLGAEFVKQVGNIVKGGEKLDDNSRKQKVYNQILAGYQKQIANIDAEIKKGNISEERRTFILKTRSNLEKMIAEHTGQSIANEEEKQLASKRTIESIEAEITRKQQLLKEEEIGSARQIELRKEVKKLQDEVAHALGQQTQEEKDASAEREKAAEKQKQELEKQKAKLAEMLKLQQQFNLEIYKASQDARNQELVDLDAKARAMQESGLEQLKIDEFIRSEEVKINKKYDDIEEEQHKKAQDQMLADLEALVDADEAANQRITDNQKEALEKRLEAFFAYSDAASQLVNALFDLGSSLREAESQELNQQMKKELEELDVRHGIKKEKETAYEKEKREIEEKFAKEQNELRLREAKAEKAQALFNIAVDTAQNIVKVFPNFVLMAIAGVLGAAQAAVVAARPLPEFRKGGLVKGGRQAIQVNEEGEEWVVRADLTKKHRKELEAMHSGKFDEMITTTRVLPLIKKMVHHREQLSSKEKQSLKKAIKAELDDTGIIHAINKNRTVELGPKTINSLANNLRSGKRRSR